MEDAHCSRVIRISSGKRAQDLSGIEKITVILSPVDFRVGKTVPASAKLPEWTKPLYSDIESRLAKLPLPKEK